MRFLLPVFFITAMSACTPRLAPQPVHTVNPVPVPVYTKHHTDDGLPIERVLLAGHWALKEGHLNTHSNLHHLTDKTRLYLNPKKDSWELGISSSVGCNQMNFVLLFDSIGNLSHTPNHSMTSTLKSCGSHIDKSETAFYQFLYNAKKLSINNHLLVIMGKNDETLTFYKID